MSHLFCGACGTKFSEGDKFCKKCGIKRKINIPDMQPSSKSNRPLQAPDPVPCNFPSASQIQAPVQLPVQSPVQKSEQVHTNKTPLNSTAQTPAKPAPTESVKATAQAPVKPASQPSVKVATQEKQSTAAPKKRKYPKARKVYLAIV